MISAEMRERVKAGARQNLSYTHIQKLTGLNYRTIRRILNAEKEAAELGLTVKPKREFTPRPPTPAEEVKMNYVRLADRLLSIAENIMHGRDKQETKEVILDGITKGIGGRSESNNGSQTKGNSASTTN